MTNTSKYEVEEYFNLKTSRYNFMYTLFYMNISEFSWKWEVVLYEGILKNKNAPYWLEGLLFQV